jgi:hypothetical protein
MNFIKEELVSKGYEVEAVFIHSSESLYKDNTLTKFIERNQDIKVHTISEICIEYMNNIKDAESLVDYEYLEYAETKYCADLPLSLLQISSQLFTTAYHYRFFFKHMSENEKLYWTQLLFKYFESLLENGKYDQICDLDISEIGRSVLFQVSKYMAVPYVSLEFSRYESNVLPTYTLGRKTDGYFVKYCTDNTNNVENEFIQKVDAFRSKQTILATDFKNNTTSKTQSNSFVFDLKQLITRFREIIKRVPKWLEFNRIPLLANPFKSMMFFVLWFIRERVIFSNFFSPFEKPILGEKYVYFPMHLIPESTTLIKSPFYPNELSVIEAISKSLPVGWKLYVKEHGAMVGERPLHFYKKLKLLTNIRLVDLSFYDDPKPWITNSLGVITLSGTSAFEAAMLNVPAIMFGNTFFESIEGIQKLDNVTALPEAIGKFKVVQVDNKGSVALYLKAIQHFGEKVKIIWLINESAKLIKEDKVVSDEVRIEIKKLVKIFGLS